MREICNKNVRAIGEEVGEAEIEVRRLARRRRVRVKNGHLPNVLVENPEYAKYVES